VHGVRCNVVHRRPHPAQSLPALDNDRIKALIAVSTSNDLGCHFAGNTSDLTGRNIQCRGDLYDVSAYPSVGVELTINYVALQKVQHAEPYNRVVSTCRS
jgi:hypothetical protein